MTTTISPVNAQKVWVFAQNPDGTLSPATIGGGGGSGTVTSIATSSPITGGPITTTGTIGCATCTTNAAALTANALVIGGGAQAASALGSLGTTTTVLHGNAAGAPTFGAVNLAADVSGQLPISAVGSSGLSGTSPITISAAGAIACPTCNTSASAITSNVLPKGSGGAQGLANSGITDNGTTISTTELVNFAGVGAASTSAFLLNGTIFTGGSGTTTFPYFYMNFGGAPTTFNTSGVIFGINEPASFAGNAIEVHLNGGGTVFSVGNSGNVNASGNVIAVAALSGAKYVTATNCTSTASPAVCTSAAAGIVQVAAAATTLQINTSAVTANSRISLAYSVVGITPPANIATMLSPYVSAISTGASFTITLPTAPTTNPVNVTYMIFD